VFREHIKILPQFVRKVLYEHDIGKLNLSINNTQTNILMFVKECGEMSMSEISMMTGLEKSSFTRSVDYLVKNGFILRSCPVNDRRKVKLDLTDKGRKAADMIKKDFDQYLNSLISDFSEKEKKEFYDSVAAVSKYVKKILEANRHRSSKNG
jgi:DNA-binding MarR family transcriptional regulator